MGYDYDALYKSTPDALGQPTAVFVDFFNRHTGPSLRVLDVGCGQGRDAIFIARMGHSVVGLDLSVNGIRDLTAAATAENLKIEGVVADIETYRPDGDYDIVLIDRTLHMLSKTSRIRVLERLLSCVKPDGWVLIADEKSNIAGFKRVIAEHRLAWVITLEKGGTLFVRCDGASGTV